MKDRNYLIEYAKFLDGEGTELLGTGYIEAKTDEWLANEAAKTEQTADATNLVGYTYENEHGEETTVLAVADEWCMVKGVWKNKPYVIEKELVVAILNETKLAEQDEQTH